MNSNNELDRKSNVCCQAPAGGAVSVVNGQFYEGGEFMPVHGLYCGLGRNRVPASVLAEKYTTPSRRIIWDETFRMFRFQRFCTFSNGAQFWQNISHAASVKTLAVHFQ